MLSDARNMRAGAEISCDVCVIGSGPAGLALLEAFDGAGRDLVLLEAGGLTPDARPDPPYAGEPPLEHHRDRRRARAFGGSSHIWTGLCAAPDPSDFGPPRWGATGWPLNYADLAPYFDRAFGFFGLPAAPLAGDGAPVAPGLEARPVGLPDAYRPARRLLGLARRSQNSHVILNAAATRLLPALDGRRIEAVTAHGPDGAPFAVRAREVIVAAGGFETPRLLMASGLGGPMVGRYFMDRRLIPVGFVDAADTARRIYQPRRIPGGVALTNLRIADDVLRREGALALWAQHYIVAPDEGAVSVAAHKRLWAGLTLGERPVNVAARLSEMACGPAALARYYLRRFGPDRSLIVALMEPRPHSGDRLELTEARDAFGMPLIRLTKGSDDSAEEARAIGLFRRLFAEGGLGGITPVEDISRLPAELRPRLSSSHPMGATRMAVDPSDGVVDAACRVHGTDNLHIASSSVFPVAGAANPTVLIVALALRIADRLNA